MPRGYRKIIQEYLNALFQGGRGGGIAFRAFGMNAAVRPEEILLDGKVEEGPLGILVSLYALRAGKEEMVLEPFKAFKDLPGSAPYVGAFAARTQQVLVPRVEDIRKARESLLSHLDGIPSPASVPGDFSLVLRPLPKIALCYIFYLADADFPASATCLFSHNADAFAPLDVLADTAEYTSKAMLEMVH